MRRLSVALATCLMTVAGAGLALAFDEKAYDAAAFRVAQEAGKPILVDVYAPWCPVCRAQGAVLEQLKGNSAYAGVTVFRVDYDNQKDAVKAFKATRQSTLVAYKGSEETGRSVGATSASAIGSLLDSTLK